jgi:hypothetical protein
MLTDKIQKPLASLSTLAMCLVLHLAISHTLIYLG